jgi:integrase
LELRKESRSQLLPKRCGSFWHGRKPSIRLILELIDATKLQAALLRYFRSQLLNATTAEDVEKFKVKRSAEKGQKTERLLRPATVNRELACGKAMYNFVIKSGVRIENPFRSGKGECRVKFLAEDNEQMRVLNYLEQKRYLESASQPLRDIAVLMLETGMRPEEVYRISRENVYLSEERIFNPFGKTKAARRNINLNAVALQVIKQRLAKANGSYLFPNEKDPNRPMLKVNNGHDAALKRSGVESFRLYDLRHTWATRAAMSGIDLVTLAAMLGHARIEMVRRYVHPTAQHQINAMRRLEAFNATAQVAEYEQAKDQRSLQISLQ